MKSFVTGPGFREFYFAGVRGRNGFFVRSAGHYQLSGDAEEERREADFGELFWCVEGEVRFHRNGRFQTLSPGDVWYYPPGTAHRIRSGEGGCRYYWLTVEGPLAAALFDGLGLPPGLCGRGDCPEELFNRILLDIRDPEPEARLGVMTAAFAILARAAAPERSPIRESAAVRARALIDENFRNPELNVEMVAERLHLHRVSLSRSFRAAYALPVKEYLDSLRRQEAMRLLRESALPVKEIAGLAGFASPDYFSRVMRGFTGFSPRELRTRLQGVQPEE